MSQKHLLTWSGISILLLKIALGAVLLWLFFRWFERSQVFIPSRRMEAGPDALGRPVEEVALKTTDGLRLEAWYFPAEAASARQEWVILLCHGNAGNLSHRLEHCQLLGRTGASVLAFDYRGYGRSEGRPSEGGLVRDAQAAYHWLRARGYSGDRILALGESLGGGVAAELAAREPVGGLILLSSFTSIPDLGAEIFPWLPVRWLCSIRFDTVNKLPRLRIPVGLLHSRADRLVPFAHAERNHAQANAPKLLWEIEGDHNDTLALYPETYARGIEKIFQMCETYAKPAADRVNQGSIESGAADGRPAH